MSTLEVLKEYRKSPSENLKEAPEVLEGYLVP